MMYSQSKLGMRIKQYREEMGLTRKELAEKSGQSSGYIANLENGQGEQVSLDILYDISRALNVTIDNLLVDSLVKYKHHSDNALIARVKEELALSDITSLKQFHRNISDYIDLKNKKADKKKD